MSPACGDCEAEIIGLLGELALKCVRRAEDAADTEARLALYARDLSAFPLDHVHLVLRRWPETSRYFPSWAELTAALAALKPKREERYVRALPRPERSAEERARRARQAAELRAIVRGIGRGIGQGGQARGGR